MAIHLVEEMMDANMRFLQLDPVPQIQVLGPWVAVHQTVTVHCLNLSSQYCFRCFSFHNYINRYYLAWCYAAAGFNAHILIVVQMDL